MNSTREETTIVPNLAARHMPDNNRCQPGTKVRGKGKGMAELAKWSNAARGSAKNRSFFLLAASLIRREVGCGPSLVQRLRPVPGTCAKPGGRLSQACFESLRGVCGCAHGGQTKGIMSVSTHTRPIE